MNRPAAAMALPLALATAACSEGEVANIGLTEPIQINGQFIPGNLPGTTSAADAGAAEDAGAPGDDGGGPPAHLEIISATFPNVSGFVAGQGGVPINGLVTNDTAAVGVRFADMGTGYWVVVTGPIDIQSGYNTFSMQASFNADDPPGPHDVLFVAVDSAGNAGPQFRESICLDSVVPDNMHACIPNNWPPTAVFSLSWDVDFDLDLHVVTPDGTDINAKTHPSNDFPGYGDAGAQVPPATARIDRDSLDHCIPDGYRREDVYWPQPGPPSATVPLNTPAHGTYLVYANPFAPCGQTAVRFQFTLYKLAGQCPDCKLVPDPPVSGEILAGQVTGGSMQSTFVTEYTF